MSKDKYTQPEFSLSLLHPRNWGVWLGFGLLAILVNILPHRLLLSLGRSLGKLGMRYGKKRVHVAQRNLELAFPEKTPEEIQHIVEENFKNTGMALIETGITWFWPTWRFKKLIVEKDLGALREKAKEGKGVLLCCVHALNLEITARAFAVLGVAGYGAFRPHNNPAYNFIQYWGRTHNGNKLIDRKDVKKMIRVLCSGERLFYLPDHDYGRKKSVFVPFFGIETNTITTVSRLASITGADVCLMTTTLKDDDSGYLCKISAPLKDFPTGDHKEDTARLNRYFEDEIRLRPAEYYWVHKRFKNRPNQEANPYNPSN